MRCRASGAEAIGVNSRTNQALMRTVAAGPRKRNSSLRR
jgi:hypothetical protein